jgi:hypothetical protein
MMLINNIIRETIPVSARAYSEAVLDNIFPHIYTSFPTLPHTSCEGFTLRMFTGEMTHFFA